MLADNTIAILVTASQSGEGCEYRVIHAQAIERITFKPDYPVDDDPVLNRREVIRYFGKATVFSDKTDARNEAFQMEEQQREEGVYIEHGIKTFDYSSVIFPSQEE